LVERDVQRRRVRSAVGDVEQLEQRRHLRLAVSPLAPFRHVEDQVRLGGLDQGGRSAVASRSITSCPEAAIASRTAWMVAGASYSASSSRVPSSAGFTRLTL